MALVTEWNSRCDVLDTNVKGMYLSECQDYDAALQLLSDTYSKLSDVEGFAQDQQSTDHLKATTLNNLAFVLYHKREYQQALSNLEAATVLEVRWGVPSPGVSLNLCVAHNALGHYDAASQFALQAIGLLRFDDLVAEKKKLWVAAWHNLGVAQLNMARSTSTSANSNVLVMFRNAMTATRKLLGINHSLSKEVVQTYRSIRATLKKRGAFALHRTMLTSNGSLPMLHTYNLNKSSGPLSQRGASHKEKMNLSVALTSRESRMKYVEKVDSNPFVTEERVANSKQPPLKKYLRGVQLHGTKGGAITLYSNPHPLVGPPTHQPLPRIPQPPRAVQPTEKRPSISPLAENPKHRPTEQLKCDMWVEAPLSPSRPTEVSLKRVVRPAYSHLQPQDCQPRVVDPMTFVQMDHTPDP